MSPSSSSLEFFSCVFSDLVTFANIPHCWGLASATAAGMIEGII